MPPQLQAPVKGAVVSLSAVAFYRLTLSRSPTLLRMLITSCTSYTDSAASVHSTYPSQKLTQHGYVLHRVTVPRVRLKTRQNSPSAVDCSHCMTGIVAQYRQGCRSWREGPAESIHPDDSRPRGRWGEWGESRPLRQGPTQQVLRGISVSPQGAVVHQAQ